MNDSLETQRKERFQLALQQKYSACLFDIDGTLTVRGDEFIPAFLCQELAKISMHVPMGVCTARKLSQALERLAPIFTYAADPDFCQSQWVLICENGGIGYFYDVTQKKYVEFFRAEFPYSEEHRQNILRTLTGFLEGKLNTSFSNEVSLVFRPIGVEDTNHEAVALRSREVRLVIEEHLPALDPKNLLAFADSGIGVTVFPKIADKPNGTVQFAKFLRERKGFTIDEKARQIIVGGDRPGPFGNDEAFLNGELGTPFSVGELYPEHLLPLPVYDESGKILQGPEGTLRLLKQLKF